MDIFVILSHSWADYPDIINNKTFAHPVFQWRKTFCNSSELPLFLFWSWFAFGILDKGNIYLLLFKHICINIIFNLHLPLPLTIILHTNTTVWSAFDFLYQLIGKSSGKCLWPVSNKMLLLSIANIVRIFVENLPSVVVFHIPVYCSLLNQCFRIIFYIQIEFYLIFNNFRYSTFLFRMQIYSKWRLLTWRSCKHWSCSDVSYRFSIYISIYCTMAYSKPIATLCNPTHRARANCNCWISFFFVFVFSQNCINLQLEQNLCELINSKRFRAVHAGCTPNACKFIATERYKMCLLFWRNRTPPPLQHTYTPFACDAALTLALLLGAGFLFGLHWRWQQCGYVI